MIPLFVSLAFRNLRKNKRNTFSIAIGLFIALTLFAAINFNLNLSRNDIISQSSGIDFNIHAYYNNPSNNINDFIKDNQTWNKIASEPEISSVVPYTTGAHYYFNQTNGMYNYFYFYGVQENYLTTLHQQSKLNVYSGTLNITPEDFSNNTIPVIGIKSSVSNVSQSTLYYSNGAGLVQLKVVGWVVIDTSNTIFSTPGITVMSSSQQEYTFITYLQHTDQRTASGGTLLITVKDKYNNLDNLDQTSSTYTKLLQRLNLKYSSYTFTSNVPSAVSFANLIVGIFQLIVIVFLIPFIFISLYISYLASQLNLESRRIQYGLYLSRGGKSSTIRISYRLEGVVLGALNGLLAFILTPLSGYFLHYFMPSTTLTTSFSDTILNYFQTQYFFLIWMMIGGAILGFLIMFIPSYYSWLNPKELLETHRIEETDPAVKGGRDLMLLMIGLSPFFVAVLGLIMYRLHLPIIVSVLILALSSIVLYIVPFSPFLITYGMSAYLSRQPYLLNIVTKAYSKTIPDLQEIIEKTIRSRINNLSRIAFIIALSFTFIIVPLVATGSLQHYNAKIQTFESGSDMAVYGFNPKIFNESSLRGLSGISSTTTVQMEAYQSIELFYVNASSYVKTANFKSYWNLSSSALTNLHNDSIFVSKDLLKTYNVKVGDLFPINNASYKIAGTFGAVGGSTFYSTTSPYVLFNNQPPQNPFIISRILIKFTSPNNITSLQAVKSYIQNIDSNIKVTSPYKIESSSGQFDFLKFILNIIDIQAYFLIFLSLGSLTFLMIIRIKERSRELGNWRSRGLDQSQLRKLITVELAILATFGFIIGIICGGVLTVVVHYVLSDVIFGSNSIIPYDFILPLNIIYIVLIYIVGTLILSLFLNYWTFKMNISKQLHYEEYMR